MSVNLRTFERIRQHTRTYVCVCVCVCVCVDVCVWMCVCVAVDPFFLMEEENRDMWRYRKEPKVSPPLYFSPPATLLYFHYWYYCSLFFSPPPAPLFPDTPWNFRFFTVLELSLTGSGKYPGNGVRQGVSSDTDEQEGSSSQSTVTQTNTDKDEMERSWRRGECWGCRGGGGDATENGEGDVVQRPPESFRRSRIFFWLLSSDQFF